MVVVKGIYQGKSIKLLESVDAEEGVEVEVIFRDIDKRSQSFLTAMRQELERMDRGIRLGGGPYYRSRDELHER